MSNPIDRLNMELESRILRPCFQFYTIQILVDWRNEATPGTADAWGRRFAIAIPIALLGVVGLIDSLISSYLALGAFPFQIFNMKACQFFWKRTVVGLYVTAQALTYLQYLNFTKDTITEIV